MKGRVSFSLFLEYDLAQGGGGKRKSGFMEGEEKGEKDFLLCLHLHYLALGEWEGKESILPKEGGGGGFDDSASSLRGRRKDGKQKRKKERKRGELLTFSSPLRPRIISSQQPTRGEGRGGKVPSYHSLFRKRKKRGGPFLLSSFRGEIRKKKKNSSLGRGTRGGKRGERVSYSH